MCYVLIQESVQTNNTNYLNLKIMLELIKKFKKVASKQLTKRVENGKLEGDDLTAALEVLSLRGIEINMPGVELITVVEDVPKNSEETEKKKRSKASVTLETFTGMTELEIGTKVVIFTSRRKKEKKVRATIGRIFKLIENGQEEARLTGDDGKRYYRTVAEFVK